MDTTKLRIRVAELCGWEQIEESHLTKGLYFGRMNGWDHQAIVPDFTADLNACHEMEKAMTSSFERCMDYQSQLAKVCRSDGYVPQAQFLWHATAEQRCRAFVATMEDSSVPSGNEVR